mmetsp:Transcript_15467/g.34727  ORF Transcript_15467/g.34727 Transcript_15467/m.34727 type:complete len:369 (-) Transcript_15467:497-1603(-)
MIVRNNCVLRFFVGFLTVQLNSRFSNSLIQNVHLDTTQQGNGQPVLLNCGSTFTNSNYGKRRKYHLKCDAGDGVHENELPSSSVVSSKYLQNANDTPYKKKKSGISRRAIVGSVLASTPVLYDYGQCANSAVVPPPPSSYVSSMSTDETATMPNFQCLTDLPPSVHGDECVRVYLCRHGQTENNRLHIAQGARVDAPLNDTGKRMALRVGRAISNLPSTEMRSLSVGVHSQLQRARQTAQFASISLGTIQANLPWSDDEWFDYDMTSDTGEKSKSPQFGLKILDAVPELGEVDFGSLNEGKSSAEVRANIYGTFGAWSLGKIDTRPQGGGESGREVSILDNPQHWLIRLNNIFIFYLNNNVFQYFCIN